jgi:hypothetical protein
VGRLRLELGKVVRTVGLRLRERGHLAIAITFDVASRLADTAEVTLPYRYDDPGFGGTIVRRVARDVCTLAVGRRAGRPRRGLDPITVRERPHGRSSSQIRLPAASGPEMPGRRWTSSAAA